MTASSIELMRAAMAQLDALLQRPETEREILLGELSTSQPQLHAMVVQLLKAERDASGSGFLEPVSQAGSIAGVKPDMQLGPYRIIKRLGAGGMGEVWLAGRVDGLYEGEVAIKTLHPHLANTAVRERFTREAHILGKLTHKNIARLHDAGVTGAGVTYLVLEYVNGEALDTWCDARVLPIRARLELFLSVCAAVAHAHAHLIVHRDLKPSNILVARTGGVKLLDFGVAKLVQGDESSVEVTALTQFGGRIFTPEYAAPEQVAGESVTTATDVYALGVVLYVLLSGKKPFGEVAVTGPALEQAILHADPQSLSQLPQGSADKVASARGTSAAKLIRTLKGDLESIVTRALRKSPKERYGSVLALAVDLERYLHQQPVEARGGTPAYRLGRFVQRHRAAAVAVVISVSALLAGASLAIWQASEARKQTQLAQVEAQEANAVKDFLLGIFNTNSANNADGARARKTTAEELLAIGSKNILQQEHMDASVRVELMSTLGELNMLLQQYSQAEALHTQRVSYAVEHFGESSPEVAAALIDLGQLQQQRQQFDVARKSIDRAIAILQARGDVNSILRGRAEAQLGHITYMVSDVGSAAALEHFRKAVEILDQHPQSRERVAATLGLAMSLETLGQFDAAVIANQRAIDAATRTIGPRTVEVAGARQQLARVFMQMDRLDEAQVNIDQATDLFVFAVGEDNGLTGSALLDAGRIAIRRAKQRDAVAKLTRALRARIAAEGSDDTWVQEIRFALAFSQYSIGDWEPADKLIADALVSLEKLPRREVQVPLLHLRAMLSRERGRIDASLSDIDRALSVAQKPSPIPGFQPATNMVLRTESLVRGKRLVEARQILSELEPLMQRPGADPLRATKVRTELAAMALDVASGHAESTIDKAQALVAALAASDRRAQLWELETQAAQQLGESLMAANRKSEACRSLQAAFDVRAANALPLDPRLAQLVRQQAKCASL